MTLKAFPLLCALMLCNALLSQVKIGEKSEIIDGSSLLELESSEKVLVITRVTTAQMDAISPLNGALVHNTAESCLFYYNGIRWINLCEALSLAFTSEPVENPGETMIVTTFDDRVNFEVGQIRGGDDSAGFNNIVDFSITSQDIQNNAINADKLAPNAVGSDEIAGNAITSDKIDFADVTLVDFVNDVGYLTDADLLATDVQYDGTLSGLAASNVQDAIDLLVSGGQFPFNQDFAVAGSNLVITDANGSLQVPLSEINNQFLITDGSPGQLSISNGNELTLNVSDADADRSNELNTSLVLDGTTLELSDAGGTLPLDLNVAFATNAQLEALDTDDADADPTNELSDLELTNNLLTLTNPQSGATGVDLSPYINTDAQDISTDPDTPGNITIENGSTLNINVDDADADPTNELSDLDLTNNLLTLTNPQSGATGVDLSPYINTDSQDISTDPDTPGNIAIENGSTLNINVDDGDADPTNELSDLELTNNLLTLTNPQSGATGVDLSPYINTDSQDISTDPDRPGNITIENGSTLSINVEDGDSDPTNELELPAGGTNGQVLTTSGGAVSWEDPVSSPVVAWGKIRGSGAIAGGSGIASVTSNSGEYTIEFTEPRNDTNYTVQLSVFGDNRIYVTGQETNAVTVEIRDNVNDNPIPATFFVTILDN